jgi:carbonic anhydrase/acetyltransferase-like protein (isoleucine patch superfamily)
VRVGEESIVAAGTLLAEGTVVPPRSLVMGSPGKVKRQLVDVEIASILQYSERYVAYRLGYLTA